MTIEVFRLTDASRGVIGKQSKKLMNGLQLQNLISDNKQSAQEL